MMNKGILVVISAPSGCGKDTIVNEIVKEMGDEASVSVSMTTREMRTGEEEGVNYYYVSVDQFKKNIENGEMLEYTRYGSNYYGTPVGPVKEKLREGKTVFLIIEVEGGENVKKIFPDCVKIFVIPPSMEVLSNRLRGRGTDNEEAIATRLEIARTELQRAVEYDYIVENDVLQDAVEDVKAIIKAEKLRINIMQTKLREVIKDA
ncbi:MAG: guanylate kinase [Clostridia bacterium]|nr:guanylate kinase [Clostridia bacterium]